MTASPFGINVVSRSHSVACRACSATAPRVGETCPSCGSALAEVGFSIVPAVGAVTRPSRIRLTPRRSAA